MSDAKDPDRPTVGLMLNAGGARGAYQAGVLQVLLPELDARGERPTVLVGTSAGGLACLMLAQSAHLGAQAQADALVDALRQVTKPAVLRPVWQQAPLVAVRYLSETLDVVRSARLRGLLGVEPLGKTLRRLLDFDQVQRNVDDDVIRAVTLCASVVRTGRVVAFTATADGVVPQRGDGSSLVYRSTRLGVEHALATAAIPVMFPAVKVERPADAAGWYVDGATRLSRPLRPAVDLGVDRLVVVSTTGLGQRWSRPGHDAEDVDLGDAAVTLLNAMLEDSLREDLRRLGTLNEVLESDREVVERWAQVRGRPEPRQIPYVAVAPGDDLEVGDLALEVYRRRYGGATGLLRDPDMQLIHRLTGSDSPLQGELLSYVLFDEEYFDRLVQMGRADARHWLDEHLDMWRLGPVEPLREAEQPVPG